MNHAIALPGSTSPAWRSRALRFGFRPPDPPASTPFGGHNQVLARILAVCSTGVMTQLSDAPTIKTRRRLTRAQEVRFRKHLEKDYEDELSLIEQLSAELDSFLDSRRDVPTD